MAKADRRKSTAGKARSPDAPAAPAAPPLPPVPQRSCDNLVFWSPVPDHSVFTIRASGDQNVFDVTVGRSLNGGHQVPFGYNDLVPGPASQVIARGERWAFTVVVSLFSTPDNPVIVDANMEDAAGNTVSLPHADGAPMTLECQWRIARVGASMIKILVAG
jgi:hypothetical protein